MGSYVAPDMLPITQKFYVIYSYRSNKTIFAAKMKFCEKQEDDINKQSASLHIILYNIS